MKVKMNKTIYDRVINMERPMTNTEQAANQVEEIKKQLNIIWDVSTLKVLAERVVTFLAKVLNRSK